MTLYRKLLLLFSLFLLVPVAGFSTHIVGGSLTYAYGGANTYTITLKLYRDCDAGSADFSPTALVHVQRADGSEFSPSRDITLPTISTSTVAPDPPPCSTPPASPPCVAERIYRLVVTLAPSPGGMHLYHQICCRNGSITNIATPSSVGESFYAYIPCYTTAWAEDFTLANGTTSDAGATAWTRTLGTTPPASAQVNNGLFEVSGANGASFWLEDFPTNGITSDAGPTAWTRTVTAGVVGVTASNQFEVQGANSGTMTFATQTVSIAPYPSGVNLSVDLSESGTMEGTDVITVSYSIDGGAPVQFPINGSIADDFPSSPIIAEATGLVGNNIQIIVSVQYSTTSPNSEIYRIDNINMYSPASMVWTSQSISIAGYPSGVNLSANLTETSTLEPSDYIQIAYSLDGGAPVVFPSNGSFSDDFSSAFSTATGLVGSTIQIFVTTRYGASSAGEIYNLDMVSVYDNVFVSNSNPVYNITPPLYFCQTYLDDIDYSATDPDGDVLVYSMYTPYENAPNPPWPTTPPPTFTNNQCIFTTVTWNGGYSATSPFNSGGPGVTLNAATGLLSGVANSIGNFVFGVKVQEYRGGVLLGETTRGYQVQTITCAPFVPPAPTAGTDNPAPICTGQTLSLTASTVAGATGYSWTGPNSFTSSLQNPTIPAVTTAASGTYSVAATVSGCTGLTGTVSITVNTTPAAPTAGSNAPVCSGQTLSLTSNTVAGSTYNWIGPNSFTSTLEDPAIASVTTAASGTYSVTRTSAAGCVSAASTTSVTINQTPSAPTAGSNTPVCVGLTLSLTSNTFAGGTYSWTGPNSFTSTLEDPTIVSVTTAASGTYSVTATVSGCTGPAGTTSVSITTIPSAPAAGSNTDICEGQTLSLTASTIASATYNWTGPNSFTSTLEDPTIPAATTAATGTYSVTATVGGCTGPAGTTSVTVNPIPPNPTPSSTSPVCAGQTLSLAASSIPGATYSWNGPNSFTSATQNPTIVSITTAGNGTYSVSAVVDGCTSPVGTTSVVVNNTPAAPAPGSNSPVCSGQNLSLTASSIPGATYSWSGPNSFTSTAQNPTIAGVTTAYGGTYSVTATIGTCVGPTATVAVTVNPTPAALTPGSNSPICVGQTLSLTANTVAGTYAWNGPNGFGSALEDPTIGSVGTVNAGTYSVTITVSGCTSPVATTVVTINSIPPAPTAGNNSPVCVGQTLSLTSSTVGGATYAWTGPNSFTSTAEDPTIGGASTAASGTYSVTVTVSGCTSAAGVTTATVSAIPAAPTAGSNSPMCTGTTLSLTANTIAGASYSWSGPNSFTSTLEDPTIGGVGTVNAGTYSVYVTVGGCPGPSGTTSVVISPPPAAPTAGSNSPVCTGYDLSLTANTIGGATYNWSGPNSFTSTLEDPVITAVTTSAGGTYSVSVTVGGCTGPSGTTAVTINVAPASPAPGSNSPVCSGQTLSLTASSTGVAYNWSGPNSFTSTVQNPTIAAVTTAASGTYSVTATGANGCVSTPPNTIAVTINATPTAPVVGSNSPACVGGDLSLTATTFAGASYSWSGPNGFTSSLQNPVISGISALAAGTYSVFATVAGCVGPVGTGAVVVNAAPSTPTPGSNSPVCTGQTLSLTTATVPSGSYNWSGPSGFTSALEDPTIASVGAANAGTYSVFVTVPGCATSGTGTVAVTVNTTPAAPAAGSNSPVCTGYNLSLTATGTGVSYNWTGPGGYTSTTEDPVIAAITSSAAGTYSVTTTSAAGCTSSAGTTAVTVNSSPVAPTAGSNSPLCSGTTLSLTASTIASATYSWTGPGGYTSTSQNPTIGGITTADAGTYSVTASVGGCVGPAGTVSVTITDPQTTVPGSNSPICSGQNLSLTATTVAGATYNWSGPNSFTSTLEDPSIAAATTAAGGTYSVTVTVSGCTGPATMHTATVNPLPAAPTAGSNSPVCEGSMLSLTANTIAGATYNWSGPNSFTSTAEDPTIGAVTSAEAGTYSVMATYTATGCAGPTGTTVVVINPPPAPPALSSNSPVCSGNTLSLTATTLVGASYSWSGPNSFTSTLEDPTIAGVSTDAAGTYSMTATVPGCPPLATVTVAVTINQTPSAPVAGSNSPVCEGTDISLTASAVGATYNWSGPNSFTSTAQNPVITGATTAMDGIYTVSATSAAGCPGPAGTVSVTVNPLPAAPAAGNNSPICEGQTLSLTASTIAGASYSWTGPGGFTSTSQDPTIAGTTTANAGTYSVNASVLGCAGPTGTTSVSISPTPAAPVVGSNSPICSGQTLSLTASSTGTTYNWNGPLSYTSTLQNPTIAAASTGRAGTYSVTATTGGCTSPAGMITVTVNPTPSVSASSNTPVCEGNTLSLTATTLAGGIYSWSGPSAFTSSLEDPTIGGTTAANSGTYTMNVTSADGCVSPNAVTSVTITPTIVVAAGADQTVCANNSNVSLAGSVSGGTSTGLWSSSGTGVFIPGASTLTTNYLPSPADTTAGTVTLTLTSTNNGGCTAVSDVLVVTISDAPVANAGSDQTVCANNATVTLSGSVNSSATGGLWASSGTGSFGSTTSLSTTYTPSSADTAAGSVIITLTTTGVGLCSPVTDSMLVTITNAPLVNAGSTISVCINNANASLSGYSSTGSGTWTTMGSGTFVPTPAVLTATYVPSSADTTAGSVILILTSTANGTCNPEDDSVTVFYTPQPTVSAGADVTVCANNATVTLSGTSSTGTGTWSTSGSGTFIPASTALAASYMPSPADTAAGSVTLTLTTTNNGGCLAVADVMTITISDAPTANAGSDQTVCANNPAVTLSGSFTTATGGIWSSSGTGSFTPGNTNMGAVYTPSAADTAAGTVTITLTTTGNGLCNAVTDNMVITITNVPAVFAGINTVACKNNPNVPLAGSSSTGTAVWTTTGTGTFTPTATTLSATYLSSSADTTAGSVILILTSTGNGNCLAEDDSITITYIDKPIVNAGPDLTVCTNNPNFAITGTSNTGSGTWTTSGTGTFTPSATLLSTNYAPSAADLAAGTFKLYLTSTNNGTCLAVVDSMVVTISPAPTANAGVNQTVCANNAVTTLSGAFTVSTGAGWTTLGTGTFAPDTFSMGVTYTPSAADTAAGSVTIVLTTTGNGNCNPVSDTMIITITDAPRVNAGPNQLVCLSSPVATLSGTSTTGSGSWSTLGSGTFASPASLATTYTASTADTTAGSVMLVLTSTANGLCNAVTDTMVLTFVPTPVVSAGSDQTVCANADTISLSGASTTGSGIWSTSGTGTFTPATTTMAGSYICSNADTAAGTVTLTFTSTSGCVAVADNMTVTITPAPVANAGISQIICAGTDTAFLSGSYTSAATGAVWSTSGTGTFVPGNTVMNPAYLVSSADSAAGGVVISLITTGNGICYADTDTMVISIVQPPTVNAGADQTLCSLPVVNLNGIITGGSGTGGWSTVGGGGTFLPDTSDLNGAYYPNGSDTTFSGTIYIVLTSTNNGNCPPSTDTMAVTFFPPPVAFAGADIVICRNNADSIPLSGIIQNAGGCQWSTPGTGTFNPDTSVNSYYYPDSADFTKDTLFLVISTTGTGTCAADSDTVLVIFSPSPVVNAGSTVLVCEGDSVAVLNGSVSAGASTGQWSSLGTGYFLPDDSTLNAGYILSAADTAAGGTTLILTSTNNGGCKAVTDTVDVVITVLPVVAAGPDTVVCANNAVIALNGSVTVGSTTGIWTSSGTGTFSPADTVLNATYTPSAADTAAGSVVLTLNATNSCAPVADSLVVTITPAPKVNAGADVSICEGTSVSLNGSVTVASGGQWSTSGNGSFTPNDSTLTATYLMGSGDTNTVTLVLTSTGNGQCLAVEDSMTITIGRAPIAGFSHSQICTGQSITFNDTSSVIGVNDTIVGWNWTIGGGPDTVQNPSHTYSVSGTDTVILIVTTNIGCTDTAVQVVNINPTPVASFTFMTSCSIDSVYFTSTSTIPSGTITSWNWNFGDGNTSTLQNPAHYYDSTGSYVVSLSVMSDSGCTAVFTDTVNTVKGITAGYSFNDNCDLSISFTDTSLISAGDSIVSWSWNFGDGSPPDASQNPIHLYPDTGTYVVSLVIVTQGGCTDTVTDTVAIAPFAIADFIPQSGTYNVGTTIAFTDLSTNAVTWMWNFGDGGTDTVQNPSHTYTQDGTLNVMLIVTNSQGCPDTVQYSLIFNTNIVAVPSAFTPNDDGVNDVLVVRGGPLKEMLFRIYNEWGNLLFESTEQSYGWDGSYKNKKQPAARYVYILKGVTYGDAEINMSGDVTIIR